MVFLKSFTAPGELEVVPHLEELALLAGDSGFAPSPNVSNRLQASSYISIRVLGMETGFP